MLCNKLIESKKWESGKHRFKKKKKKKGLDIGKWLPKAPQQESGRATIGGFKCLNPAPVPAPFRPHHVLKIKHFQSKNISNKGEVLLNLFFKFPEFYAILLYFMWRN